MAAERAPKYRLFSSFGLTQGSPIWAALVIYAGYVVWWRRGL